MTTRYLLAALALVTLGGCADGRQPTLTSPTKPSVTQDDVIDPQQHPASEPGPILEEPGDLSQNMLSCLWRDAWVNAWVLQHCPGGQAGIWACANAGTLPTEVLLAPTTNLAFVQEALWNPPDYYVVYDVRRECLAR